MQGQNVKKLIIYKMSHDAISSGGGIGDGIKFLSSPEAMLEAARTATAWVSNSLDAVRQSPEPNKWKTASDDEIAAEILSRIEEVKRSR